MAGMGRKRTLGCALGQLMLEFEGEGEDLPIGTVGQLSASMM